MSEPVKIIDYTFLENFTKGNTEKMISFVQLYLRTAPKLFNDMLNFSIQKKWEDVSFKAHNLKSQVQYMGVIGLDDLLISIELIAKGEQEKESLTELVFSAVKLNNRAVEELKSFVSSNTYS